MKLTDTNTIHTLVELMHAMVDEIRQSTTDQKILTTLLVLDSSIDALSLWARDR